MAGETYYFVFSVLGVLLIALHATNLIFLKMRGQTLFGEKLTKSSIGYKKIQMFYSKRGITVAVLLALILIGNLIYDVRRILNMENTEYAHNLLLYYLPAIVISVIVFVLIARDSISRQNRTDSKKHE